MSDIIFEVTEDTSCTAGIWPAPMGYGIHTEGTLSRRSAETSAETADRYADDSTPRPKVICSQPAI